MLTADYIVNNRESDCYLKVREITNNRGVDFVYEHIDKTIFPQELSLLNMGSTLVSAGATTGYDSSIDLRYLFFRGNKSTGCDAGKTKAGFALYRASGVSPFGRSGGSTHGSTPIDPHHLEWLR